MAVLRVLLCVVVAVISDGGRAQAEPSFAVKPSATLGAVGHSVTIYCTITNLGRYDVFWNVNAGQDFTLGPNTNQHASYRRFQFVGDQSSGQFNLQIDNVSSTDGGTYICLVRDPTDEGSPVMEAQADLTVLDNPTLPNSGYPQCQSSPLGTDPTQTRVYMKGETLTLSCTSKGGVPLPQLSWVRLDKDDIVHDLPSTTTVIGDVVTTKANISLSSTDNGAFYKCIETHPLRPSDGRECYTPFPAFGSRIDVRFAPEVDITPNVVTVEIFGVTKVTLSCQANGNPLPTELPQIILPVNKTGVYPQGEMDKSLVEVELTTDDIGKDYYCIAQNVLGVGEDRVDVQMGAFPTWLILVIIGGIAVVLFFFIVVIACVCCIDRSDLEVDVEETDPNLLRVTPKRSTKKRPVSLRHEGENEYLDDGMIPIDNFQGGQENLAAEEAWGDKMEEPAGNSDFETGERGPRYQNVNEVMREANALHHDDDEILAPYNPEPPVDEAEPIAVDLVE